MNRMALQVIEPNDGLEQGAAAEIVSKKLGELTGRILELWEVIKPHWREIGKILWEVKEYKLYKARYGSFEGFCEAELPFGRSRAYRIIEVESIVRELPKSVADHTQNVEQALVLKRVPRDKREAVLRLAAERAGERNEVLTAQLLASVWLEICPPSEETPAARDKRQRERRLEDAWARATHEERRQFLALIFFADVERLYRNQDLPESMCNFFSKWVTRP